MWKSRTLATLALLAITRLDMAVEPCLAQDKKPASAKTQSKTPTTNQAFMREKLARVNELLGGLAVEDFDKVAESAKTLRMISRAASWYVFDSDQYLRYSKNFQEQAADLERHAKDKNSDAAELDYMRLSMTCIECHKYMRSARQAGKP